MIEDHVKRKYIIKTPALKMAYNVGDDLERSVMEGQAFFICYVKNIAIYMSISCKEN